MLLALDLGNTNVVGGLFEGEELRARWRVRTVRGATPDELGVLWERLLRARNVRVSDVTGVCLASVVPALTGSYAQLARELFGRLAFVANTESDLGIVVETDNPAQAGIDRVLNALAARERYGAPALVIDFGTATKFDVVSGAGRFVGGAIAPGLGAAVEALVARAPHLPHVPLERPTRAIGTNTVACMQSGAFFGYVGLVEGLIERLLRELGGDATVIATGGLAALLAPEVRRIDHHDPDLTLDGIRRVWERNAGRPPALPPLPAGKGDSASSGAVGETAVLSPPGRGLG
jgi:type III pantothenate kinase